MTEQTPQAPPTRTARRRARNRGALISAAAEIVATSGVGALTVTAVTDRADLGSGTFYNYFDSREDVIAAVITEEVEMMGRRLDLLTRDIEDAAEVYSFSLRHLVGMAVHDPLWGWLVVRLGITHEQLLDILGPRCERDLTKGITDGRFSIPDLGVATATTLGGLLSTMYAHLHTPSDSDPALPFAEGMLRAVGLPADEAHQMVQRPLPPLPSVEEAQAQHSG